MSWTDLLNNFDQKYDFISRINANKEGSQSSKIHPVIKLSAGLTLNSIFTDTTSNRLILLFPKRFNADKWIATLSTLELMRRDYNVNPPQLNFYNGQKLQFNNKCVVEFDCFDNDQLWIRAADSQQAINTRLTLRLNRILELEPISSKRSLSSVKKVLEAYHEAPNCPIDTILQIRTLGNHQFFQNNIIMVDRIGVAERFINEYHVNGNPISGLFLWGKLNVDGEFSLINNNLDAKPSCIVSPDMYSLSNFIYEDSKSTKGVIISSNSFCINDLSSLDYILDSNIPVIVSANIFDIESLRILFERNFKVWQWNERGIQELLGETMITSRSLFYHFNHTLHQYSQQNIFYIKCNYTDLDVVIDSLFQLDKEVPDDHFELRYLFTKLFTYVNEFSRLLRVPSKNWLTNFRNNIQKLLDEFSKRSIWLSEEAQQYLSNIFEQLGRIMQSPFSHENNKLDQLQNISNEDPISDKIIVLPKNTDIAITKKYWENRLENPDIYNHLYFIEASKLSIDQLDIIPDRIIVCGWLGKTKMYSILHSFVADEIAVLLYPFEERWFKNARTRWKNTNRFPLKHEEWGNLFDTPMDNLRFLDFIPEKEEQEDKSERSNIIDFELKIKRFRYSGYGSSIRTGGDTEKTKLVVFNNDQCAFFTAAHHCIVITDLIDENTKQSEVQRLVIDNLKPGDHLLFRDSDKDLIREVADRGLASNNQSHFREIAGMWKESLKNALTKYGLDGLIKRLRETGCNRHPATIKNWLENEEIIGPRFGKDIDKIIIATKDERLKANVVKVKNAIRAVRGAHLQASSFLTRQLINKMPNIIANKDRSTDLITLEIDNYGVVTILRIEEIGDEWLEIDKSSINRLLDEEELWRE